MLKTLLERFELAPTGLRVPAEPHRRIEPMIWMVTVVALLAVVATVVGVFVLTGGEPESAEVVPQAVESVHPGVLACRLAAQGQIPAAACNLEAFWTARLETKGPIPSTSHDTLSTREELQTLRLAREGRLPRELLRSETLITKRLVDDGLIPPAAAN